MQWATQVFQNGELWSLTDTLIVRERKWRPAHWRLPFIPVTVFEKAFYRALHKNVPFAVQHLGLTFPCHVELGLLGLRGVYLAITEGDVRGPIQFDEVIVRVELNSADPAAINLALLEFFSEVFDKTGYVRPQGLHHFPPGPPRA